MSYDNYLNIKGPNGIHDFKKDNDDNSISFLDILTWKINEKEWDYMGTVGDTDTNALITIETNIIKNLTITAKG